MRSKRREQSPAIEQLLGHTSPKHVYVQTSSRDAGNRLEECMTSLAGLFATTPKLTTMNGPIGIAIPNLLEKMCTIGLKYFRVTLMYTHLSL